LRIIILCTIAAAAVSARLFSVIRTSFIPLVVLRQNERAWLLTDLVAGFESIIHECSYRNPSSSPSPVDGAQLAR
jgi:hypothetical protein